MTGPDEDQRLKDLTEKEILFEIWSELRSFRRFNVWGAATLLTGWVLMAMAVIAQSS